jgi:hypothetical protein
VADLQTEMKRLKDRAASTERHRFKNPMPVTQACPGRPPITAKYPDLLDTIHGLYLYEPGQASEKRRRDELTITMVTELRRCL